MKIFNATWRHKTFHALRDGKILVQKDKGCSEYALPGGSVQIGETAEAALIREYKKKSV